MKKAVLILFAVSAMAAVGLFLTRPVSSTPTSPALETNAGAGSAADDTPTHKALALKPVQAGRVATEVGGKAPPTAALAPASSAVQSAFDASRLAQAVDVLVSPQASFAQKQEAWRQLRAAGKLDAAISDLEQRAVADPRTAEYPAALGQAYLQKCATLQDVREQGILGMQADKAFDAALALDPANWEARFTKAVAMSYWPAVLNKGDEVVRQFQTLIQQQEAQTPQPQFAETYAWLGDQYQKNGQPDQARAVWERGAAAFPSHEGLKGKLAAQQ